MSNYIYALDTTNKRPLPINVDSNGNLQVDIVSGGGGGGDATASNQTASKAVLDNILTKNGEIETTADAILAKNTEIETTADAILAKNGEIETTANSILAKNTEIETTADAILAKNTEVKTSVDAVNTSLSDVASATKQQTLITANHADLVAISGTLSKMNPDYVQSTLVNNALITSGGDTSEIDMGDHRHLTLFGTTDTNFGNWILIRKSGTGGTKIPDGSKMISASEAIASSGVYSFAITIENVGTRYLALRNTAGTSQTSTIYQVLHR